MSRKWKWRERIDHISKYGLQIWVTNQTCNKLSQGQPQKVSLLESLDKKKTYIADEPRVQVWIGESYLLSKQKSWTNTYQLWNLKCKTCAHMTLIKIIYKRTITEINATAALYQEN